MLVAPLPAGAAEGTGEGAPGAKAKPAQPTPSAKLTIKVGGLRKGRATILQRVPVRGTLNPYVPGQKVTVTFYRDGRRLLSREVAVGRGPGGGGVFSTAVVVREDGRWAAAAKHAATPELGAAATVRKKWKVRFPGLRRGQCGKVVVGFKRALRKMGYIANSGRCFGDKASRGVLAYRKVNEMSRTMRAGPALVKAVFAGKGAYRPRYPKAGDHLEAPLSKQILAFVKNGKPYAIYPISSGKPSTPTVTGHYEMIRTEPGLNSHGMYYSWYFYRGYAVHGYASVPDYPASHGCLRTFMADQPEVYKRIFYGQDIYIW